MIQLVPRPNVFPKTTGNGTRRVAIRESRSISAVCRNVVCFGGKVVLQLILIRSHAKFVGVDRVEDRKIGMTRTLLLGEEALKRGDSLLNQVLSCELALKPAYERRLRRWWDQN